MIKRFWQSLPIAVRVTLYLLLIAIGVVCWTVLLRFWIARGAFDGS
jgi:hypothetical protein